MARDRGRRLEFCHAHDYGDPGYPASECDFCKFENNDLELRNARRVVVAAVALFTSPASDTESRVRGLKSAVDEFFNEGGSAL